MLTQPASHNTSEASYLKIAASAGRISFFAPLADLSLRVRVCVSYRFDRNLAMVQSNRFAVQKFSLTQEEAEAILFIDQSTRSIIIDISQYSQNHLISTTLRQMGNQEIKAVMHEVTKADFPNNAKIVSVLQSHCYNESNDNDILTQFFSFIQKSDLSETEDRYITEQMEKVFQYHNGMNFEFSGNKADRWDQIARDLWQSGYTTWQHNQLDLKNDQTQQIVLSQSHSTALFEYQFYSRSLVQCAHFLTRFQGSAEMKDVITYCQESHEDNDASYTYKSSLHSVFFGLLNSMTGELAGKTEQVSLIVNTLLDILLRVEDGRMYRQEKKGIAHDLLVKRVREFLLTFIENENTSKELRAKCVELLMRMGIVAANAENLILAAQFQLQFEIDISRHLTPFFPLPDKFEPPTADDDGQTKLQWQIIPDKDHRSEKRLQSRCEFKAGGDRQEPQHKALCDGHYYYSWAGNKGLLKTPRKSNGEWETDKSSQTMNQETSIMKEGFTMFVHKSVLYARNKDITTAPFKAIDRATMKFSTESPAIGYANEESKQRFSWTHAENNPATSSPSGYRWMAICPMASDGEFIYTLVYHYEENSVTHNKRKSLYLEKYSLDEEQKILFISEVKLVEENSTAWLGRGKKTDTAEGGYLNYGSLVTNGEEMLWLSRHNVHIFNVADGVRKSKQRSFKKDGAAHITCYDKASNKFYGMDAAVYSWLDEFEVSGYTPKMNSQSGDDEKQKELPEIQFNLNEAKKKIKHSLPLLQEPHTQANILAQVIGGDLEQKVLAKSKVTYKTALNEAEKKAAEELAKSEHKEQKAEDLKADGYVFDWTRAIILAQVSKIAQKTNHFARRTTKQLDGLSMLKFVREKNGISLSESMFKSIRQIITSMLETYSMHDSDNTSVQLSLKNMLHIYIAHIGCLRPLHLKIKDIISEAEMGKQKEFLAKLEADIQLFPRQKEWPDTEEEIPEKQLFQLHIYHLRKQIIEEMEVMVSTDTVGDKIQKLIDNFSNLNGLAEIDDGKQKDLEKVLKQYHTAEIALMFDQDDHVIGKLENLMYQATKFLSQRIQRRLEHMVEDVNNVNDETLQGFGQVDGFRTSEFIFNFLQELMIVFAYQKKLIVDNKLPENKDDFTDEQKTNENRMRKTTVAAEEKIKKLQKKFYEMMIKIGINLCEMLRQLSSQIYQLKFNAFWNEDQKSTAFKHLESMLFGKIAPLRSIMQFTMQIQVIDIQNTELDEVHLCLKPVIKGMHYLNAALDTLRSQQPDLRDSSKKFDETAKFFLRHIGFAEAKTAARLAMDCGEKLDKSFNKISILNHGIQERYIPCLSDECKHEIQGSFKIVADRRLQALSERSVIDRDEYSSLDEFFEKFLSDEFASTPVHKSLFETITELQSNMSDMSATDKDSDDNDDVELSHALVIQAFVIMLHFQEQITNLKDVVECLERNERDDVIRKLEPLHQSWAFAKHKVKKWLKSTRQTIEEKVKKEITDEYMKKLKEDNPDGADEIKKLTDEQQSEVDQKVVFKTTTEVDLAIRNASQKLKFLRYCEPTSRAEHQQANEKVVPVQVFYNQWTDIQANANNIQPNSSLKRNAAQQNEKQKQNQEAEEKALRKRILDDVISVIETDSKWQKLQEYVEGKLISGLRRLAGLEMFNGMLESSDDVVFFDALHCLTASLRQNKAKICHYLSGVNGCGNKTEQKIQNQFEKIIQIISLRLKHERDPKYLVLLLDSLIWNYRPSDMVFLAQNDTIRIISGCVKEIDDKNFTIDSKIAHSTLRAAWGREQNFFSIENIERPEQIKAGKKYSLSARLQQCFDFLVYKTFQLGFATDQTELEMGLQNTFECLLQQIFQVIFVKFDQYLAMIQSNEMGAAEELDQAVRFDAASGENEDKKETMVDQFNYAEIKDPKEEQKRLENENEKQEKLIEKFILALNESDGFQLPADVELELKKVYKGEEDQITDIIRQAILRREWRAFEHLRLIPDHVFNGALNIEPEEEEQEEERKQVVNEDNAEKISQIDGMAKESEKIEAYLTYMRDRDGEKAGITQTVFFSKVTLTRLMKHVSLLLSLAETDVNTAQIPFKVMKPTQLETLVQLSLYGPTSIQMVIQKVFQSFMRINIPQTQLDKAVHSTQNHPKLNKISQTLAIKPVIKFQSFFWQLMFNQIQIAKQAQFSPAYQVELGKPVVVQEIARTFLTYSLLDPIRDGKATNYHDNIQRAIEASLKKIDTYSEDQIASIFQLVPEAITPVISTGKRAMHDKEQFVVLGFKESDEARKSDTQLSMVAQRGYYIQGLVLKEGKQIQKTYELRNVTAVEDIGEDTLPQKAQKNLAKKYATQQNFMKPEVLKKLINVVIQKESFYRNDPQKANGHRYLQHYVQKGIKTILSYFKDKYMTVLKSFGMLESLITYLSQTASIQMISPEEPLVSSNLLAVQAQEVQMVSHHTNLSTGFYTQFQIFVNPQKQDSAFLLRSTEDRKTTQFMDIPIVSNFGLEASNLKISCIDPDEKHSLINMINGDADKCSKCEGSFRYFEKAAQKKTGFMHCSSCNQYFCNKCVPKMQTKKQTGLQISLNTSCLFRIARNEAILIKSADLNTLSNRTLQILRQSNMVITDIDANFPLIEFVRKLNQKISEDITWKECSQVEIIQVSNQTFTKITDFITGVALSQENNTRGHLISRVYRSVNFTQPKIEDQEVNLDFITKFLQDYQMEYQEFRDQRLQQILEDEIRESYKDDQATQITEISKMKEQIDILKNDQENIVLNDQNQQLRQETLLLKKESNSPDFMSQLVPDAESKIILESGRDFFSSVGMQFTQKEYQAKHDEIVFDFNKESPLATHRKLLNSFIDKSNQLGARSIWLFLLSQVKQCDQETRDSIKITGKNDKIVDLIHDSNQAASHQELFFGNSKPKKQVHEQITAILQYFDEGEQIETKRFRDYFNQNMLTRADVTIEKVKLEDLQSFSLKDLRKIAKYEKVLDPSNLIFFAKQVFERRNYITEQNRAQMAKTLFDLHLGFAILYKTDEDQQISLQLIKGASWALDLIIQHNQQFLSNNEQVKKFFTAPMLQQLFKYMETQSEDSNKKRLMTEVLFKLNKIYSHAQQNTNNYMSFQPPYNLTADTKNIINGYEALLEGSKFTSQIARFKLIELMNSQQANTVVSFGRSYKTDKKMFITFFKKVEKAKDNIEIVINNLSTDKMIGIKNLTTGESLDVDSGSIAKGGKNTLQVAKGDDYEIQFPIAPNEVYMTGKLSVRGLTDEQQLHNKRFTRQQKLTLNAMAVRGRHHHIMYVGIKGEVMGQGYRAGGKEAGQHALKVLNRPAECNDYADVRAGKFFRLLLSKTGKLFFSGQNKKSTVGNAIQLNDCVEEFKDVTDIFTQIDSEDKIISCDGGKHFLVVCTAKGRIFASGTGLYHSIDDDIRTNEEAQSDYPFEIKMIKLAEGYKAEKVWACDLYDNIWVLGYKDGESIKKTFCLGSDYDMVGGGDSNGARSWRQPRIHEDKWFEQIESSGMYALGIDNKGDLWEWGGHRQSNQGDKKFFEPAFQGMSSNSSCYQLIWFNENHKKVKKIRTGKGWGLILAQDEESGDYELYALGSNDMSRQGDDTELTTKYGDNFKMIKTFSNLTKQIVDFEGTMQASVVITQTPMSLPDSIIKNEPQNRDFLHLVKGNNGNFEIIKPEDVIEDQLPNICFATRHPIKNFEVTCNQLPSLPLGHRSNEIWKGQYDDYYSGQSRNGSDFVSNVMYYSKMLVDGQERISVATKEEAMKGGRQADMVPMIYYRIKGSMTDSALSQLKAIDTSTFFTQIPDPKVNVDSINFSIQNQVIKSEDILNIQVQNAAIEQKLLDVQNFEQKQDFELLRAIDQFKDSRLKDEDQKMQPMQYEIGKMPLSKIGLLSKQIETNSEILQYRLRFLVDMSSKTQQILRFTYFEAEKRLHSISNLMMESRELLLPSVKQQMYTKQAQSLFDLHGNIEQASLKIQRQQGADFWKLAKKNNADFITESIFGQLFQQLTMKDSEFTCFQRSSDPLSVEITKSNDDDDCEYSGTDFMFRLIEQELQSDFVPLLIKTPNGQNAAGIKRDCWLLNPSITQTTHPDWMKCYQLIGSLLARYSLNSDVPISIAFAPTFWRQFLCDEPTLEEFALEDAQLAQRLLKLEQAEQKGQWPMDEKWNFIDYNGEVKPIEDPIPKNTRDRDAQVPHDIDDVLTREEYDDFKQALQKKLNQQTQEQMSYVKQGMWNALGDASYLTKFLNWHDMMVLTERLHTKNYSEIDAVKKKVKYIDCEEEKDNQEHITMFWKIYESFSYEDKKNLFIFWLGRSRIGWKSHHLVKEDFRIRLDEELVDKVPISKPEQLELVLPVSYDSEDQFRSKLLGAMKAFIDQNTPLLV